MAVQLLAFEEGLCCIEMFGYFRKYDQLTHKQNPIYSFIGSLLCQTHITLSLFKNITRHSYLELALLFKMAFPKDVICHCNVAFISCKVGSYLLHVQTQATCQ